MPMSKKAIDGLRLKGHQQQYATKFPIYSRDRKHRFYFTTLERGWNRITLL